MFEHLDDPNPPRPGPSILESVIKRGKSRLVRRRLIVSTGAIFATGIALLSINTLVGQKGVRVVTSAGEPTANAPPPDAQSPAPELSPSPSSTTQPSSSPTPTPSSSPTPTPSSSPTFEWAFPPLTLSINIDRGEFDGPAYVGPQARGSSGCAEMVTQIRGSDITVEGVRSPSGPVACTANVPLFWAPIAVSDDVMKITIHYQGQTGVYELTRSAGRVRLLLAEGMDVSPPVCADWWDVPPDILDVFAWSNVDAAAAVRVSEHIHDRLLAEGASKFDPPPGRAIVTRLGSDDEGGCGGVPVPAWRDRDDAGWGRGRIYRTSLDDNTLQQIANEESGRERCAYVQMIKRAEYGGTGKIRAQSPC